MSGTKGSMAFVVGCQNRDPRRSRATMTTLPFVPVLHFSALLAGPAIVRLPGPGAFSAKSGPQGPQWPYIFSVPRGYGTSLSGGCLNDFVGHSIFGANL